ncbi:MAG TPA: NAD(P)-dependent oxidoreductase [Phycisphaerae bacterium]|nr:NAD(P)-dependent oxidoreductase [Phycisphaerae bacterium]
MKVLIADKFESFGIDEMKKMGCEVTSNPELKDAALTAALKELKPAVLIVRSTKVNSEMIGATDTLKVILRAGSGVNTIDVKAATAKGVKVANCPGLNSTAVAELTMGLMLALDRRIPDNVTELRSGSWNKKEYGKARGLKGRTLGVLGMGQIGRLVARRALAFEMSILYHDVIAAEEFDRMLNVKRVSLDELLKKADIVTLHVPALPETKNMMNEQRIGLMQKHAFLINTCRGDVVDEPALIKALKEKKIAAAAADVYAAEPANAKDTYTGALRDLPNFYGTHHIGASTDEAQTAVAWETVRIVREFKNGGKVLNAVN